MLHMQVRKGRVANISTKHSAIAQANHNLSDSTREIKKVSIHNLQEQILR